MVALPVIGITCRVLHRDPGYPPAQAVYLTYIQSVAIAGGAPILIPLLDDQETLRRHFDLVDGLLLPGGEDVDPSFYGEYPHSKLGKVDAQRDKVETQLIKWARHEKKPLFGICRGAQIMNVACGGTLFQDLPSEFNSTLEHFCHGALTGWEQDAHDIELMPDCKLANALGLVNLQVNSLHHQAVKELGHGLRCVGKSSDGCVEALEDPDHLFFVGVQCHPECLWQNKNPRWKNVFAELVQSCKQARA